VIQREQAMLEAAVKDGVTATTATAAMVALNPAAAAKVIFNACVVVYGSVLCNVQQVLSSSICRKRVRGSKSESKSENESESECASNSERARE